MENSSWRIVFQCSKCTFKYQIKPNFCTSQEGLCKETNFLEVKVYCLDKILSFNAFMNIIIGGRRKGKTFSIAEFCVKRWEESKSKFVWCRRYKTEMKKALESFSKLGYLFDAKGVYFENEIVIIKKRRGKDVEEVVKEKIYIGLIVTISTASRIRGGEFNSFHTLVIDEYGDESGTVLKKEFDLINSLIVSIIDEKSDGIVFVLTNNVNRFLPLFSHLNIDWEKEWNYNWKVNAVAHIVQDNDRKWVGSSSKWLKSTEYFDYAVYNKSMDLDPQIIDPSKLDYSVSIFCFNIFYFRNYNLRIVGLSDDQFVVDVCNDCDHEKKIIDDYNKFEFCKPLNLEIQNYLFNLFLNKQLMYSKPEIKNIFRRWFDQNKKNLLN